MASSLRIEQGLRQRLALTPGLVQALAILRMTPEQLREDIARETAENPFLVAEDETGGGPSFDLAVATAAAPVALAELLTRQILGRRAEPAVEAAAIMLAHELDEDGYLRLTLDELAAETGVAAAVFDAGLAVLQGCDPVGVGARDLRECLALQLVDRGLSPALSAAVVARLDDFAAGATPRLARALRLPADEVARIGGLLRDLSPFPARRTAGPVAVMIPDLLVDFGPQGQISVRLNPAAVPRLSVLRYGGAAGRNAAVDQLVRRAGGWVSAIAQRGATLLRIGETIVADQSAWFLGGGRNLSPVTRADLAARLGLHPSTVGRAIAGKGMMTGGRTVPLADFFSRPVQAGDSVLSVFDLQSRIRAMIASEDATKPLADDAISTQLRDEGVDIARRTVTKYRKCMRIPSSFERRRAKLSGPGRAAGRLPDRTSGPRPGRSTPGPA
jgi:RNA polymerase sigma-54 factor